jgi:hypothetical protein
MAWDLRTFRLWIKDESALDFIATGVFPPPEKVLRSAEPL